MVLILRGLGKFQLSIHFVFPFVAIVNELDLENSNSISIDTLNCFFNKLYAYKKGRMTLNTKTWGFWMVTDPKLFSWIQTQTEKKEYSNLNPTMFIKYSTRYKENLNRILNGDQKVELATASVNQPIQSTSVLIDNQTQAFVDQQRKRHHEKCHLDEPKSKMSC